MIAAVTRWILTIVEHICVIASKENKRNDYNRKISLIQSNFHRIHMIPCFTHLIQEMHKHHYGILLMLTQIYYVFDKSYSQFEMVKNTILFVS